ncbi:DNA gyrase inhibitor YacG [Pseudothioclava arenosa]|uniref:DNA gyrase inhibitor YacG n=1 Tax=Pseudothioclava arenosa TaxID=1795308 RepID=A0A2A4CQ80_9RHOB|nr:DNA gyrase inhibitor YacG [Pseudothioclava arenosa]PCD78133.1 DNA gyrase inhibitor YacG [Pseudothioclava arenosa]
MSCPICAKGSDPKYRPFCSKRCADVDLGRWLRGAYVIPGTLAEEEERASEGAPADPDKPLH